MCIWYVPQNYGNNRKFGVVLVGSHTNRNFVQVPFVSLRISWFKISESNFTNFVKLGRPPLSFYNKLWDKLAEREG